MSINFFGHKGKLYSVDMMIKYVTENNHPIHFIHINKIKHCLRKEVWGVMNISKFTPMDVINNPHVSLYDYQRIMVCDLLYPIIIFKDDDDKYMVVDGYHRLAKSHMEDIKYITIYIFTKELLQKFRLNSTSKYFKAKL